MIALFFDTETTGIKSPDKPHFKPALVQLGCILQDLDTGRVLAELNLIANQRPMAPPIPQGAINVHGITDEMAATYGIDPKLIDIAFNQLMRMADILVAHNIEYDLDVLRDNMPLSADMLNTKTKAGILDIFCTMKGNLYIVKAPLSDKQRAYFGMKGIPADAPYKVPNLTETYMFYFAKPFESAHDAMADIRACRDIFDAMRSGGWYSLTGKPGIPVAPTEKLRKMLAAEESKPT